MASKEKKNKYEEEWKRMFETVERLDDHMKAEREEDEKWKCKMMTLLMMVAMAWREY